MLRLVAVKEAREASPAAAGCSASPAQFATGSRQLAIGSPRLASCELRAAICAPRPLVLALGSRRSGLRAASRKWLRPRRMLLGRSNKLREFNILLKRASELLLRSKRLFGAFRSQLDHLRSAASSASSAARQPASQPPIEPLSLEGSELLPVRPLQSTPVSELNFYRHRKGSLRGSQN